MPDSPLPLTADERADLARLAEDLDTLAAIDLEGGNLTPEDVAAIFAHPDVTGDEDTGTVWGRVMLTYGQVAALIRIERTGGDTLLADLTRVEAERDLYASALPYVLRPLSGGGHSVWIAGGTDSHVGDVPPGLTTAEVHALAMLAVWARLDADEKRDREHVARVEEALAEAIEQRRIDQDVLDQWQRTLGARLGVGERPCLDDAVEALARVEGDLAGAWEERERTRQWTRDLDKACAQRDAETEVLRAALARVEGERDTARAEATKMRQWAEEAAAAENENAKEVERLRAELVEAEATIANERGEGESPVPGWVATSTTNWHRGEGGVPGYASVSRGSVRAGRRPWIRYADGRETEHATARGAMIADLARRGGA